MEQSGPRTKACATLVSWALNTLLYEFTVHGAAFFSSLSIPCSTSETSGWLLSCCFSYGLG
jgi:hypothetical protein